MTSIIRETNFKWLGQKKTSGIFDIYEHDQQRILIATDRYVTPNQLIACVPRKGEIVNRTSMFWMEKTKDIVSNHFLSMPDPNVTIAKNCRPLSVKAIVRGFLTEDASSSLWSRYLTGQRDFGNFKLMDGMRKNQRLLRPVFSPTTSPRRSMTPNEMVHEGLIDRARIDAIERISLQLFERGQQIARKRDLILVDANYEFGIDAQGELTLIGEIHTPDSSRWWYADTYEERFKSGDEPADFDTESLHSWYKNHVSAKEPALPKVPAALILELSTSYQKMFKAMTAEKLTPLRTPLLMRITKNLRAAL